MKHIEFFRHTCNAARVGAALVLIGVLAACGKHDAEVIAARPVQAQKVVLGAAADRSVYSGDVRARYENDLAFRITGKIAARYVDVGATVKKGQALAKLDPNDAQLSAEAAKAQMLAAQTDFNFAQAELARYTSLLDQHFISKAAYEQKLNSFNNTKAKFEQQRMQYAWSRNQAGYTTLAADADGVITAVNAEAGQVVAAGQPVMKLARPEQKEVVINVPESRLAELRQATEVAVNVWAQAHKLYVGKLREVSPAGDPATRTYTAKVTILDPDAGVQLGMTANVLLQRPGERNIALLPLTALTQQDGAPAVWIIDPKTNRVNLRPVQIGQYRVDGVTVLSGLQADELVVTAGVHQLVQGQAVRVYSAGLPPESGAGQAVSDANASRS
jgi:membrane fusion protein, multidrug efflux system